MQVSWWMNALGLYLISVGALLICLYLWKSKAFVDKWLSPEGKQAYAKHNRLLLMGVGLLAIWMLLQYVMLLLL